MDMKGLEGFLGQFRALILLVKEMDGRRYNNLQMFYTQVLNMLYRKKVKNLGDNLKLLHLQKASPVE